MGRNMATAQLALRPFLTRGIADTFANSTDLSFNSHYALSDTTTEASSAIGFIEYLLIVVAFDAPTQAALDKCGDATDKLLLMMLLSTAPFALMVVGKAFQAVYEKYCRPDKGAKLSFPDLMDQIDTELRLLKEELREHKASLKQSQNGNTKY